MSIDLKFFAKLALEAFDSLLLDYGFERVSNKIDSYSFTAEYLAGDRYVSITAITDPRDSPNHFNIILGEGSMEWPERDWNSIALWRLRNLLEQSEQGAEYDLENVSDLHRLIDEASTDLVKFHGGFLEGDMKAFKSARSVQNRARKPYTIHEPDGRGAYRTRIDPESASLKDKFSRE